MFKILRNKTNASKESLSDDELIQAYLMKDDLEAYGELYKRYSHLIYGLCLEYLKNEQEAYDAVMDVFEKVLQDLKAHQITNFKSWLYSFAKNHCLMQLRHRDVQRRYNDNFKSKPGNFMDSSFEKHLEDIDEDKRMSILKNALAQLKEHQQICIKLFYLEESSYDDIVSITGFSLKKVKSYIQNGKRNLSIILKEYSEFEK